jgi:glutamine synthetase adenylyltransferase
VFVYEDEDERAPEVYAAFVRKLINWLTIKTGEGDLFEIDTALRPNGNSGLLVTSFEAYTRYQQQRGSNTAWTWEHQAMTRARCVLGDDSCASALTRSGDRHHRAARHRRCAAKSSPCARRCAAQTRPHPASVGAPILNTRNSTSNTAPAAWWTPSSRCSSWCCPSPRGTRS